LKVTLKQIAELCGVSLGTVTRALKDRPGINPQTKERILRVSGELGYRPHLVARSLRMGKTMTIGIIVYDLDNRFFSQLVNALEAAAKQSGYFFYLTLSNHDLEEERSCLERLVAMNVDGILVVPTNKGNEFVQFVKSLRVPVVAIGNRLAASIPFVGLKDRQAIRDAIGAIAAKGYERVVFVSPPLSYRGKENIYEVEERYQGFREGIAERGLESLVLKEKAFGEPLVRACHGSGLRTAVMCTSDKFALEALLALRAAGLRVPDEVGLIGFDDIDMLKYVTPSLTTISYPTAKVAEAAFGLLLRLMEGAAEEGDAPLIEPRIIMRESL
jgi:LacI family transcriptional regulator